MRLLKLFSDCVLTRGAARSTIVDLTRENYVLIPNSLYDLLVEYNGQPIDLLYASFPNQHSVIDQYIKFLDQYEMLMNCREDELEHFPKLNLDYQYPGVISNAIIDLPGTKQPKQLKNLLKELADLGCAYLQIRGFEDFDMDYFRQISNELKDSAILNIELIVRYSSVVVDALAELAIADNRISRIIVHSVPPGQVCSSNDARFFFTHQCISEKSCGVISANYFAANMTHFSEASGYNTCLNRKIAVDAQGRIKNCPSMQTSFGTVGERTLAQVTSDPDFTHLWDIDKSKVTTCKVCEFRNICTDCRAYLEDPADLYSKPLKCGYDPITAEWQDWSSHPVKQAAIAFYQLTE